MQKICRTDRKLQCWFAVIEKVFQILRFIGVVAGLPAVPSALELARIPDFSNSTNRGFEYNRKSIIEEIYIDKGTHKVCGFKFLINGCSN